MTKLKTKINWYFLIAGIIILYSSLTLNNLNNQPDFQKLSVKLKNDIIKVKGRNKNYDYIIWTNEYQNQFNIPNGGISRGKHKKIANLKAEQAIEIFISKSDYSKLTNKNKEIDIIGINYNKQELLSIKEYYINREMYKSRIKIFGVFTAIMLILNTISISSKINYWILGIFIGLIIIMRIFEFGIY